MKRLIAIFILLAIGLLASFAQAGRKTDDSRFITEEQWTQEVDGKKVFIRERIATNAMEDVGSLPPMQRPARQDQVANPRPGVERQPEGNRYSRQPSLPPGAKPGGNFFEDSEGLLYREPGQGGRMFRFKAASPPSTPTQSRISRPAPNEHQSSKTNSLSKRIRANDEKMNRFSRQLEADRANNNSRFNKMESGLSETNKRLEKMEKELELRSRHQPDTTRSAPTVNQSQRPEFKSQPKQIPASSATPVLKTEDAVYRYFVPADE